MGFADWEDFFDRSGIRKKCLSWDIRRAVKFDSGGVVRPAGSILVWQSDVRMNTAGVVNVLKRKGLQPDDLWSQFVLAVTQFDLRVGGPVVALGQNHVPLGNNAVALFVEKGIKNLQLRSLLLDWLDGCRFVVRPIGT